VANGGGNEGGVGVFLKDLAGGGGKGSGGLEIEGTRGAVEIMLFVLVAEGSIELPQDVLFGGLQP
jgi:hypothetical protein